MLYRIFSAMDVLRFFDRRPRELELYRAFAAKVLAARPDTHIRVLKARSPLENRHGFAFVSLPRRKVGEPSVVVSIGLPYRISSPRIWMAVEPYPNRWTHHLLLSDETQLDAELMGWITESRRICGGQIAHFGHTLQGGSMLTYHLDPHAKTPLYEQLYRAVRADIMSGTLAGGERLPSKRQLAANLRISQITVETAYSQLLAEGYLVSEPRRAILCSVSSLCRPPRPALRLRRHRSVTLRSRSAVMISAPTSWTTAASRFPPGAPIAQRAERILRPPAARDRPLRRV